MFQYSPAPDRRQPSRINIGASPEYANQTSGDNSPEYANQTTGDNVYTSQILFDDNPLITATDGELFIKNSFFTTLYNRNTPIHIDMLCINFFNTLQNMTGQT